VRSDEELALSVLRYGKILSRKLENRMQVSQQPRSRHGLLVDVRSDQGGAHGAACAPAHHAAPVVLQNGQRSKQVRRSIATCGRWLTFLNQLACGGGPIVELLWRMNCLSVLKIINFHCEN
jgi:hypothetical protein